MTESTGPTDARERPVSRVKSAERAIHLIERLATSGPASLTVLSQELGLPKSSMHALVATLRSTGWIGIDKSGFIALGFRAQALGLATLDDESLVNFVDDLLDELYGKVDETVHLAKLEGVDVVYLKSQYSTHALTVRFEFGRRLPAYVTALGKAMLAELPSQHVDRHIPRMLSRFTPNTITSRSKLVADLAQTRARGYAVDDEESSVGLKCFSVGAIFGPRAAVPIAMSCSVPVARLAPSVEANIVASLLDLKSELHARSTPKR